MLDQKLHYSHKKLSVDIILAFFYKNQEVFPEFANKQETEAYALKLSELADFIVCENASKEIVGLVAFYMNRLPMCYLTFVCVSPSYWRMGIFKRMLEEIEKIGQAKSYSTIKLEVRKDNYSAINAYENLGFRYESDSIKGQYMHKKI